MVEARLGGLTVMHGRELTMDAGHGAAGFMGASTGESMVRSMTSIDCAAFVVAGAAC